MAVDFWPYLTRGVGARCSRCIATLDPSQFSHVVPPAGPSDAEVVFVGEAPGGQERDEPFQGNAGDELNNHYLPLAKLERSEVYITNVCKCRPPSNRTPNVSEINACAQHFLVRELDRLNPKLVVLMGGTASSIVDGDPIDLESDHGRHYHGTILGRGPYDIMPTYHPALGLHVSNRIDAIEEGFANVGNWLRGKYTEPVDEWKGEEEYVYLEDWGGGHKGSKPVFIDSESEYGALYSWQFTQVPGVGIMVQEHGDSTQRIDAKRRYLQRLLNECKVLVMQNAIVEVAAFRQLGIHVDWAKVTDTMQIAYRRAMSQGLKPLARRHCGMKMQSYLEVTNRASKRKVQEWIIDVADHLPALVTNRVSEKTGKYLKPSKKENPMVAVLDGILRSMHTNPKYDPWKRWREHKEELPAAATAAAIETKKKQWYWREWLLDYVGSDMPQRGLRHVDPTLAKWYACRDADATCRVYYTIGKDLDSLWKVREYDWNNR
jgi:DNA polymerase